MIGEKNLNKLLSNMSPVLNEEEYVFVTLPGKYGNHAHLKPIGSFKEKEGLSLILSKDIAIENEMSFEGVFKLITLDVHSSLNAIGLTAIVAEKLKDNGISANVVAAFFHDHIFVQSNLSREALKVLKNLTK